MRTFSWALILITACLQVGADDAARRRVASGDQAVVNNLTLVATVFGEPLYLEALTPAQAEFKRKELPQAEFDEWLRTFRGA